MLTIEMYELSPWRGLSVAMVVEKFAREERQISQEKMRYNFSEN